MSHSFPLHIAYRYLFSKKNHNAINIVSGVSAAAIGVVTAAMVCVLSVMNGFGALIETMFSQFDPDIHISSAVGKSFQLDDERFNQLQALPYVTLVSQTVEETALIAYKNHQTPAHVMGVDDSFRKLTAIDSIINDGYFCTFDGGFNRAVLGRGLAAQIGINPHFVGGLYLYAPKRHGSVNMLRPDNAFNEELAFISGTFAVNQTQFDDNYILISLRQARELFEYDTTTVTALLLQVADNMNIRHAKREIKHLLGDDYLVLDRYEQQADFFRMLKVEKLLTALLLVFILLIASFNIISSLSMLMLDKRDSITVLSHLGANEATIRRIFLYEGWLISSFGAGAGLVLGVIICLIQQFCGIIKLGTGTEYIISAYPVQVQAWDIVLIAIIVLCLGFAASWYPIHKYSFKKEVL